MDNSTDDPPPPPADADDPHGAEAIAPRARPGYRSAPNVGISTTSMAALFAGVVRAVVGLAGFFASLLMLPVHQATPILAGVSVLLVVTGNVSAWRAIEGSRAIRLVFGALAGLSVAGLLAITLATAVWGAGALRPTPQAPEGPSRSVRFEMAP